MVEWNSRSHKQQNCYLWSSHYRSTIFTLLYEHTNFISVCVCWCVGKACARIWSGVLSLFRPRTIWQLAVSCYSLNYMTGNICGSQKEETFKWQLFDCVRHTLFLFVQQQWMCETLHFIQPESGTKGSTHRRTSGFGSHCWRHIITFDLIRSAPFDHSPNFPILLLCIALHSQNL